MMARTPLLRAFARMAAVHGLAWARHVDPEVIRAERAREPDPQPRELSRREFLLGSAAAAAFAALPAPARAAAAPRIAIVGGGLGGLTAALTLADAGVGSTVYEASSRVGGRMHSDTRGYWADGQVSEWCGELVNQSHTTVLGLARRFGLQTVDLLEAEPKGSEDTYHFFGQHYPIAAADRDFRPVYRALRRDLKAAGPQTTYMKRTPAGVALDRLSVREWIESRVPGGRASRLGALLDVAYAVEYGAETTDQSALNLIYLLGEQPRPDHLTILGSSDERYRLVGGNERLPAAIAAKLPSGAVRLGWRMTAVERTTAGGVTLALDTPDGSRTVRADHAILALPFAALRTLDYTRAGFDPLKHRAIQELGRGRNSKLHLQFRTRHWRQGEGGRISTGASYTDTGYQATWESSRGQPGASGLLVNYALDDMSGALAAPVPYGDATDHAHVADTAKTFLARLEPVWPGITAHWNGRATLSVPSLDPNLNGSYAYYRTGQYHTFAGYEGTRQRNIHFAGEHCSVDYQGYMEGAAAEGVRAAKAVLADLRRGRTRRR